MEKCSVCGRTDEEVRLFDGLYVNDSAKVCERCSLASGIPIIKRPSTDQLKESEKPFSVRSRLTRMAHLPGEEKKEQSAYEKLKQLSENPVLEKPAADELVFKLVDNFHWVIQTARRRRGLSAKQLAEAIHESETAINMLEKGIVPSRSMDLVRTLEQYLNIMLIKRDFLEKIQEEKIRKAREEGIEILEEKKTEKSESSTLVPLKPIAPSRPAYNSPIMNLQRQSERIEKDFLYEKKTKEDIGKEQVEALGKEDTEYLKRTVYKSSMAKSSSNPTPTIYDLMKKKEASLTGKDIELIDENSKQKTSKPANWNDLE